MKISDHIPNKEKREEVKAICEERKAIWIEFYNGSVKESLKDMDNHKYVAKANLR